MNASELPVGCKARICECGDFRLRELGFESGEIIRVLASMPFSGPRAISVGASLYALNQSELSLIQVEQLVL